MRPLQVLKVESMILYDPSCLYILACVHLNSVLFYFAITSFLLQNILIIMLESYYYYYLLCCPLSLCGFYEYQGIVS